MSFCPQHALESVLETECDLSHPIPPGAAFGTVRPKEDISSDDAVARLPWPPLAPGCKECSMDAATREVRTSVWGVASLCEDGLFVEPLWRLSEDKMLLTVQVDHVDCFGEPVTAEGLFASAPEAVERLKLDPKVLDAFIAQSRREGGHVFAALARGVYPEPGKDGEVRLIHLEDKKAGTLREDGSMDFRERGGLQFVRKGTPLGEVRPPVPGTNGFDIFGVAVPPPPVNEAKVNIGEGVVSTVREDGSTEFTAAQDGVLRYAKGKLEVSTLIEIEGDVDLDSGNIRAQHGSVRIKGAVRSGFKVEAAGDVVVEGLIEEADVEAGGLVVAGGVIMNGKNTIKAEGNVQARFFQNAVIRAGGDVISQAELSHCDVVAGGDVTVLEGKGIISGGRVLSYGNIVARILGNQARAKTVLELLVKRSGEDELLDRRNGLTEELERLDEAIGSGDAMSSLMTAPEEDRRILAELIKVRGRLQGAIRALDGEVVEQRRAARKELAERRVTARQQAFSGVEVIIGKRRRKIRSSMEAASFHLNPDLTEIVND